MISYADIKNKNIVITGGSSGIGAQCAFQLAELDANIFIIGRSEIRLKENVSKMGGNGRKYYISFDLDNFDDYEKLIDEIIKQIGPVFGFIHSAGIEASVPFKVLKSDDYLNLFKINTISGFELARLFSKKKNISNEGGSFVFIASVMGLLGQYGKTAYGASKGAIITGVKSIALELAKSKIRVNCISPGVVDTSMTNKMFDLLTEDNRKKIIESHPLGIGEASDVANMCIFLLSEYAKWITGANMVVDGGYSIL